MAFPSSSDAFRNVSAHASGQVMDNVARLGMSPRQLELNRRWSFYCCTQYDARMVEWDGTPRLDPVEREAVSSSAFLPPGFYDPSGQLSDLPLAFRRPISAYHLGRVIVNRFTGLLFSERRHPKLAVLGDPATEDYVNALAEDARLWMTFVVARNYGGGTGTAVVGFQFSEGRVQLEVHDPRWILPRWRDRSKLTLAAIEKRYQYPIEMRNRETGVWEEVYFWYRRIIDDKVDIVYEPAPVGDGEEPVWKIQESVEHNFGFCPVVWIQNQPVVDDIDGEPDCQGIYDNIETIDRLLSQAVRGTVANCDPTPVAEGIEDTSMPSQLKKGSGNLLKLPKGTFKYAEISGTGPKSAMELVDKERAFALEVAQCTLDHPDVAGRTATEIERVYSSMLSKADILREQYGVRGVIPLVNMILKAIQQISGRVQMVDGQAVRSVVVLPPKVDKDGNVFPRKLGKMTSPVSVAWPGYFEPSVEDANKAAQAANVAKIGGLVDELHAAKFVSAFFGVEDVPAMLATMKKAKQQEFENLASGMSGHGETINPVTGKPHVSVFGGGGKSTSGDAEEPQEYTQYELETGLCSINEWRASKKRPPWPKDGELTVPQYRAKYPEIFLKAIGTEDPDLGASLLEDQLGIKPPAPPPGKAPPPPGGPGGPPKPGGNGRPRFE